MKSKNNFLKNAHEENKPCEKVEDKNEIEVKEKGFYLMVRSPFDNYKKGDIISDFDAIELVEKNSALGLCIKFNSKGI